MVRAGQDRIGDRAAGGEPLQQALLHLGELLPVEQAAADPRLIGNNNHGDARLVGQGDDRSRAVDQPEFVDPAQVAVVLNDHSVAIEEEGGAQDAVCTAPQDLPPHAPVVDVATGGAGGEVVHECHLARSG